MIYISFPLRISLTSASMQYAFIWMISLTSLAFWIFHSFALICLFLSLSLSPNDMLLFTSYAMHET